MTNELRAAAERFIERDKIRRDGGHAEWIEERDGMILARAYLAENDDTPIEEAWLRSFGFTDDRMGALTLGHLHLGNLNPRGAGGTRNRYACVSMAPIKFPSTRGQLRRLCEALGVELKVKAWPRIN